MENELKKAIELWSKEDGLLVYETHRTVCVVMAPNETITQVHVLMSVEGWPRVLYADMIRFVEDAIQFQNCTIKCEYQRLSSSSLPQSIKTIILKAGTKIADDRLKIISIEIL